MKKMIDDLRSQLQAVEDWGEVLHVRREVNPRFELPAICKKLEADKALLFEKVKGYSLPVVVGLDNSRSRIARVLGTDDFGLTPRYLEAILNPLPPTVVQDGPVKEVRITKNIDLAELLPVITHYEKDGGPFITAGVVIAEDPGRRIRNLSYHRLQVMNKDEIGLFLQPRHLWNLYSAKEKEGKPLEVAVAIGLDASIRLAGATSGSLIPLGFDELSIAGALRHKTVEIVRGETVGVMAPAKKDAIYQDLLPFTPEHHLLLAIPYEPVVYQAVKSYVPGTKAVHVTPSGSGKFHAVVCIRKDHEEDGKKAILAGLNSCRDIKLVTVVDEDVDPFNFREVEWAVATRFQVDRDLVVISGARGNELDPSCSLSGLTAKMGMDATRPLGPRERFEKVRIPGLENIKIQDYLKP